MNASSIPESLPSVALDRLPESNVSRRCEEFERLWSNGEQPRLEDFLDGLSASEVPSALERLLTIELAHRGLSGETVSEQEYQRRFPNFAASISAIFGANESLSMDSSVPHVQSSTLLWDKIARAVDPAVVHTPNEMIGRYRLIERVGRGGFGEVWRATDTELGRDVAIKLARSDRHLPQNYMHQLRYEAQLAASLRHPAIVPVYDIAYTQQGTYIVSEFVTGETLAARLYKGAVDVRLSIKFAIQIADALHHAHQRGLVHRDVKPGNILLRDSAAEAVLTDFGLAVTEAAQLGESRSTAGTWCYMSPEQARGGEQLLDARSDIYSLGVVLFQMLTGRFPFAAKQREEYLHQLLHEPARPLRSLNDSLDAELEQICMRCLSKAPADRFATSAALASALRDWETRQSQPADPVSTSWSEATTSSGSPPRIRKFTGIWIMAAIGILAVVIIGAAQLMPKHEPTEHVPNKFLAANILPEQPSATDLDLHAVGVRRNLMAEPPAIFAWSTGGRPEKPRFDSVQKTFTVRDAEARWIATASVLKAEEFELEADIFVKDWDGTCGLVWNLRADPKLAPDKTFRCLSVEYHLPQTDSPPKLRLRQYTIHEHTYDQRRIEMNEGIVSRSVPKPATNWATLKCRVSPEQITVSFNQEDPWVIPGSSIRLDQGWIHEEYSFCGMTGTGEETKVRGLSVHVIR